MIGNRSRLLLALALASALSLRAATEPPAPTETAGQILDRVMQTYANCDSYSARIYVRQVFFSPAISIFQKEQTSPKELGPIHYQALTVRMRRPGDWLVEGTLTSVLSAVAGQHDARPTTAYIFGQAGGGGGKFAAITASGPGQVEEMSAADFSGRLKARLFSQGLAILEPLFNAGGKYAPADFPRTGVQLEGEETVAGRTFYRLRIPAQGVGGSALLLWVDKASAQIERTLAFKEELMQQFTETIFLDQDFHATMTADSLAFAPPDHLEPLSDSGMGFTDLFLFSNHLVDLVRPPVEKPVVKPVEKRGRELTTAQLAGVVIIEGDNSVATGFTAKIRDIPVVVTNLHVLGTNKSFSIRSVSGATIGVQAVIGAVGADIALLRIANPASDLTLLPLADDVSQSTKTGDDVVVVGNRLGGGVASQTTGTVLGVGPSTVELSAQFQSGNSGSPIFDMADSNVIGVAAYSETVTLKSPTNPLFLHSEDLRNFQQQVEQRWFGFRLDAVKKWETIDLAKWKVQHAQVEHFRDQSLALLSFLSGDHQVAKENLEMRQIMEKYQLDAQRSTHADLNGVDQANNLDQAVRALRAFCDRGVHELEVSAGNDYDYFRTNPYWIVSIPDQLKFRGILKVELENDSKDLEHFKDLLRDM
jgi:hypothetical protein